MTNDYERYNFWKIELDQEIEKDKQKVKSKKESNSIHDIIDGSLTTHEEFLKRVNKNK